MKVFLQFILKVLTFVWALGVMAAGFRLWKCARGPEKGFCTYISVVGVSGCEEGVSVGCCLPGEECIVGVSREVGDVEYVAT